MPEVVHGFMQEAMPYEELNKLVNEDLLNQYIESRYSSWPCSFILPLSDATFQRVTICLHAAMILFLQRTACMWSDVQSCWEGCREARLL